MPLQALRKATLALATFDSIAALGACATEAGDPGTKETAPDRQNAVPQPAEKLGSESGFRPDAAADTGK